MYLWVLQESRKRAIPERETQVFSFSTLWSLTTFTGNLIVFYNHCWRTYRQVSFAFTVFSRMLKPKSITTPLILEPSIVLLMLFSTIFTVVVPFHSHITQVQGLLTYLYWLILWIYLIHVGGKAVIELRAVGRGPYFRSHKKMKHKKIRRPKLPFYKRNFHRKRVRLRADKISSESKHTWSDDGDPLQGTRAIPYWKYLHTSVLGNLWDDLCSANPDIVMMTIGGDFSFIKSVLPSYHDRVIPLGLHSSCDFNLTKATQTNDLFRFQSVFHVQSETSGAPIVFDSGASISITPYAEDL